MLLINHPVCRDFFTKLMIVWPRSSPGFSVGVSSVQLNTCPDSARQQLMMNGVARAEEIKDGTLDCMASPASKAFPDSHPRRMMSLVLPAMVPAGWQKLKCKKLFRQHYCCVAEQIENLMLTVTAVMCKNYFNICDLHGRKSSIQHPRASMLTTQQSDHMVNWPINVCHVSAISVFVDGTRTINNFPVFGLDRTVF